MDWTRLSPQNIAFAFSFFHLANILLFIVFYKACLKSVFFNVDFKIAFIPLIYINITKRVFLIFIHYQTKTVIDNAIIINLMPISKQNLSRQISFFSFMHVKGTFESTALFE